MDRKRVATVLTVYGIETSSSDSLDVSRSELQQYLPFTVLKLRNAAHFLIMFWVATVLTVYGIETLV